MSLVYFRTFLHFCEEPSVPRRRTRSTERSWAPVSSELVRDKQYSDATDSIAASACEGAEATTIMLRNIANKAQESDIRTFLDQRGFEKMYDVVVLPSDVKTKRNRGYCFINFSSHEQLQRAMTDLVGQQIEGTSSKKLTEVRIAAEQFSSK
eukprot:CAMPEP_0204384534 /NCGR_PEP_ID=MMETSP0469-20131031/56953_1 /ASSEMBLY_ACC=CAM_ASM_000384 /TAXON_ID=2969 /ORGANISM="Oxyrrhis marina" /LENGTH=151 /DNA_ID=CAMNT_0051377185 /DNA_START=1 /DNA_END=456 /DNA_ORIENTATION=+